MKTLSNITELQTLRQAWQKEPGKIAFVPTMGNLHAGHIALVEKARESVGSAGKVVVSIFVNPLQFGPKEDFNTYPRTPDADLAKLVEAKADAVFLPTAEGMYPQGFPMQCRVEVSDLANQLCGKSRPGHFSGVATVVAKLFNLVRPDFAIFGQKDLQQVKILQQMVRDLNFPLEMIVAPTIRESDGLAMSSRNQYLSLEERKIAPKLYEILRSVKAEIASGNTAFSELSTQATQKLSLCGFKVDYLEIRNGEDLSVEKITAENCAVVVAAWLGKTRLIDNIVGASGGSPIRG